MPVTAKLSRKFYDTLGDEVANELVDWLNAVDLSYRSEFRDLFETHFGRFEARLAQQTVELRAEFGAKLAALEGRMVRQFAEVRAEMDAKLAALEGRMVRQFADVDTRLASFEARLIRWMFTFWIGTVLTTVGAMIALRHL